MNVPRKPHLIDRCPLPLSAHNADTGIEGGVVVYRTGEPRRRAIIYGAGLFKHEAPLDDPSWEVWALNLIAPLDSERRLRADRWFDIHQRVAQTEDDMRWIAACPVPIYLPDDLMDASPNAVRYPIEDVEAAFGGPYWACTFAYQIALAMHLGFEAIGLYGVELAYGTDRERTMEWACTAYWLGRAEERGLEIHLPGKSTLGRHVARYGLEYQREIDRVKEYTKAMRDRELRAPYLMEEPDGANVGG